MYTRSYNEEDALRVPEGYSGVALKEGLHTDVPLQPSHEPIAEEKESETASAGLFGNLFNTQAIRGTLGHFFSGGLPVLSKIGTEEILILATAAFLFFAGDGDKECAIMLLLLLFIN